MASRNLSLEEAVARLERRGGQIRVHALVRHDGAPFLIDDPPTFWCRGREDGATVITGPNERRWLLRSNADRAVLAADIATILADLGATAGGPELGFVLEHRDELEVDGGYGQVGCVVALVSTAVGLVLGIAATFVVTGTIDGGPALGGPVVGFLVAMLTGDAVGRVLTGVSALRDHVVALASLYMAIAPGLVTFIIIVIGSAATA